ncbi:MAG: hypothetical protein IPK62_01685 [Bacteroidetes bacterium]|nr:hypothetical protein [Bacteroidota bacterium]
MKLQYQQYFHCNHSALLYYQHLFVNKTSLLLAIISSYVIVPVVSSGNILTKTWVNSFILIAPQNKITENNFETPYKNKSKETNGIVGKIHIFVLYNYTPK